MLTSSEWATASKARCLPRAASQTAVEGCQVGTLGVGGGPGGLHQGGAQGAIAFARGGGLAPTPALMVARRQTCPRGQVCGAGELRHVEPHLGQNHFGAGGVNARRRVQQRPRRPAKSSWRLVCPTPLVAADFAPVGSMVAFGSTRSGSG